MKSEMNDEVDLVTARGPVPRAPLHGSNHEKSARRRAKLIQDRGLALPDAPLGNITVMAHEIDVPSGGVFFFFFSPPSCPRPAPLPPCLLIVHGNPEEAAGFVPVCQT